MNPLFLLTPLLAPASGLYWFGLSIHRWFSSRRSVSLPQPVLSVGNLTWGGTGKTPLLLKLVQDLSARGVRPAVLSRGYRGLGRGSGSNVDMRSDEVALMARRFPNVPLGIGADRAESAEKILASSPVDVFILDDGFQHWKLKRTIDIVCLDATDPWGGNHLIPWGRLREPKSGLERSQAVVVTRAELVADSFLSSLLDEIHSLCRHDNALVGRFTHQLWGWNQKQADLSSTLRGSRVLAVSAVGNPMSFEANLKSYGAEVTPLRFPDHYPYTDRDVDHIAQQARRERSLIVVTEKDEVKLRQTKWSLSPALDLFVLRADLCFSPSDEAKWARIINEY